MALRAARSMAITFGLLLFLMAAVMVVNASVAQAIQFDGPGNGLTTPTIPNPDCEVGVVFYEPPHCDCPAGVDWSFTYEPGHEGDSNYITSGVCGSVTTLTGDTVPSLTQDTSVSNSAYSSSLPSTGLPLAVLFAGGLAAAGAGLVFAGRRRGQ